MYKVCLKKLETGEEHIYEGEDEFFPFNWFENNFSCDCNRGLFFDRSVGMLADADWDSLDYPCGDQERFVVVWVEIGGTLFTGKDEDELYDKTSAAQQHLYDW